ncbi:MAG: hypothetical protein Q9190_003201 [Brigantiaea leucoxantha]
MGIAEVVSRVRAGSILRSPSVGPAPALNPLNRERNSAQLDRTLDLNEKQPIEGRSREGGSLIPDGNTLSLAGDDTAAPDRQLLVRTIPTWVQSPRTAQIAPHHYNTQSDSVDDYSSRWRLFAKASAYPATSAEGGELVTEEWLVQNGPDYSKPWLAEAEDRDVENARGFRAKRKVWWKRAQHVLIRKPLIPLILRSIVWIFSMAALCLAASIHHMTDNVAGIGNVASTEMAIIVDVIALMYLLYITYDEYTGKPLGLRPARAKMRLIFLDLFFIVFDSANLSLAFEAVRASGVCSPLLLNEHDQRSRNPLPKICGRQKSLASVLLIALISWLLTFTISVLRLVERVTRK